MLNEYNNNYELLTEAPSKEMKRSSKYCFWGNQANFTFEIQPLYLSGKTSQNQETNVRQISVDQFDLTEYIGMPALTDITRVFSIQILGGNGVIMGSSGSFNQSNVITNVVPTVSNIAQTGAY
jgi:hypothetical protein